MHDILSLNLWELKLCIQNSLELKEEESDEAFWTFFANPTYRMHEKDETEKCDTVKSTKKRFFQKIDLLINQLRSDRELLRRKQAKTSMRK